jgi:hypothetical protein
MHDMGEEKRENCCAGLLRIRERREDKEKMIFLFFQRFIYQG